MARTSLFIAGLALLGLILCTSPAAFAAKGGNGGGGGKPPGGGGDPPAGSPEIAYFLSKGDKIQVMDADGANPALALRRVSGVGVQPSWSPDGTQLVYNATTSGSGIYVTTLSGSATKLTSTATQYVNRPVWSPVATADGSFKILFEDQASNGSRDLFLMDVDGSNRVNLTNTAGVSETHPTWNPTATKFAAVESSNLNDGNGYTDDVVVYDLGLSDGELAITTSSNITLGTSIGRSDLAFIDWGRTTGGRIAVSRNDGATGDWDIWLIAADGTGTPTNLTNSADAWERQPTWSPNDAQIAYWYDDGDSKGVYVESASGGTPVQLTANATAPDWKR